MLLTMNLSWHETALWRNDSKLRTHLKLLAGKQARARGRRFWQIVSESGRLLVVGECF
jgi:hypothetical protein